MEIPNLLAVQLECSAEFLQREVPIDKRKDQGLEAVFNSVFPIESPRASSRSSSSGTSSASRSTPTRSARSATSPSRPRSRRACASSSRGRRGERREAAQGHHRAGGLPRRAAADHQQGHVHHQRRRARDRQPAPPFAGRVLRRRDPPQRQAAVHARIIPYRGSWVEFTLDINDIMYVHIDRKRKLPVTMLLQGAGLRDQPGDPRLFYQVEIVKLGQRTGKKDEELVGRVSIQDVIDKNTGEVIVEASHAIEEKQSRSCEKPRSRPCTASSTPRTKDRKPTSSSRRCKKDSCADQEAALRRSTTCCVRASRRARRRRAHSCSACSSRRSATTCAESAATR